METDGNGAVLRKYVLTLGETEVFQEYQKVCITVSRTSWPRNDKNRLRNQDNIEKTSGWCLIPKWEASKSQNETGSPLVIDECEEFALAQVRGTLQRKFD